MRAALPFPALSPAAPAAVPSPRGVRSDRGLALALALVPLALYARVLFFPALEVSDAGLASPGTAVQAARAGGLGALALHLEGCGADSMTVPYLSRLVSLLLHAGATTLVFGLARRLGAARGVSVLAALLFAVHPIRVETVAWLSRRGELLGGFLFLLGAFLSAGAGARRALMSRAAFVLALLAEPRLLLGSAWLERVERRQPARGPRWPQVGFDLALACAAVGWLLAAAPEPAPDAPGFVTRLAHAPLALAALARQWLLPFELTPFHPHPALSGSPISPWVLGAGWLGLALVVLALRRMRARTPEAAMAGLLFVLLGAPQALLSRGPGLFSESSGYTALLGLELLLIFVAARASATLARPVLALGALIVLSCAARSAARLTDWSSEPALQAAALSVRGEPRAHDALGQWHLLHGRLGAAQREHERALALAHGRRGEQALARLHLGELELRRALIPGQERHLVPSAELLEECVAAFPGWSSASERLGEVYQRRGEDERALAHFEAAAELCPSARGLTRLGMLRRELSDPDGARAAFTHAIALEPRSSDAWCGLGMAQFQADELDAARAALERALALEPDHVEARATLARIHEARGANAEAERDLRRALAVNPGYADGLYALGMLLSSSARAAEALRYLDRVCELPRRTPHVRAHLESARLRLARGEVEVPRRRLCAVLDFNPEQAEARALLARLPAEGGGR